MKRLILAILITVIFGIFGLTCTVQASFGISPPWITNYYLTPGSYFEKTVYLIRGEPDVEMRAEASIDAPEIEKWIKIDKGLTFSLPKGEQKVPVTIILNVPQDAELGPYRGCIRINAIPLEKGEGQVSIISGVRIDFDLIVVQTEFADFNLLGVSISDFEEGSPLSVLVSLENLGNIRIRPFKVHLDIYDIGYNNILASGDITEMSWIGPFEINISKGEWQNSLKVNGYWGNVTVYKKEEIINTSKVYFQVIPKGTLKTAEVEKESKGFSYFYLGIGMGVVSLIVLIILLLLILRRGKIKAGQISEKRIKRVSKKQD